MGAGGSARPSRADPSLHRGLTIPGPVPEPVEPGATGPEPPPRWGLGDAAGGAVAGLVLGGLAGAAVQLATGDTDLTFAALAASIVAAWVGQVGCCVLATRSKGSGSLTRDFGLRLAPIDLAIGAGVGVAAQILLTLLYLPFPIDEEDLSTSLTDLAERLSGAELVALMLLIVIGAPVVEELFFRGLVLRSLQRRFDDVWAMIGSGLIFGFIHLQLLQLPALALFGILLAWTAVRTGRLGAGIVAHIVFNAMAMVSIVSGTG